MNQASSSFSDVVAYGRAIREFADRRFIVSALMILALGAVEFGGLLALIPLLEIGGIGMPDQSDSRIGTALTFLRDHHLVPSLPVVLGIFLALTLVQATAKTHLAKLVTQIQVGFTKFLRDRLHRAIVRAEWAAFLHQRSSDILATLMFETQAAGSGAMTLIQVTSSAVQTVVQMGIAFYISPSVTGVAVAAAAVLIWITRHTRRRVQSEGRAGLADRQALTATVSDHLAGLKLAKSHGAEANRTRHFDQLSTSINQRQVRISIEQARGQAWVSVGSAAALCGFLWFVIQFKGIRGAELALLGVVYMRIVSRLMAIQSGVQRMALLLPSFGSTERLRTELATYAAPANPQSIARLPTSAELKFDRLTFTYPSAETPTLHTIDLTIAAGQTVALCGPSGAGKSTLADIALGLLHPDTGMLRINEKPLDDASRPSWRASIAYVPQDVFLFNDTLRYNLTFLDEDATDDQIWSALEKAAAADLVRGLANGLDTLVGDRGIRLSGGERQRIALARALLRSPVFLVLDEATSSLDNANERIVQRAIEQLRGKITILIIAHRLSTIRHVDKVVVIEAGRIVEIGSWDGLMADANSRFAAMTTGAII